MADPKTLADLEHVEPHPALAGWHPDTTPHLGRHPAHLLEAATRAHGQRPWPDGGVDYCLTIVNRKSTIGNSQ